MTSLPAGWTWACCIAVVASAVGGAERLRAEEQSATQAEPAAESSGDASSKSPATEGKRHEGASYETKTLRGRVVWMADALERRFDVTTVPEAQNRLLALETAEGALYPIVEDLRGRAFRKDERLRDRPVELLVRQFEKSPMVQVVRLYAVKEDGKYELDYWCDICAIAMFELKACDCCQGPIELRERKVE